LLGWDKALKKTKQQQKKPIKHKAGKAFLPVSRARAFFSKKKNGSRRRKLKKREQHKHEALS